jgi:trehalose/maltose hydrolase-like predicted phosphorylase
MHSDQAIDHLTLTTPHSVHVNRHRAGHDTDIEPNARFPCVNCFEIFLEAENDSANHDKLAKQADVLMVFYLFSAEELGGLFARLGSPFEPDPIPPNVAYYDARSSHGSTLSRVVHAWVLARADRPRALRYFAQALRSDVRDIQQGATAEGAPLGAMAATVDLVQRGTMGGEVMGDMLGLTPRVPQEVERLDLRLRYRGHALDLRLTHATLTVRGHERGAGPINLGFKNEVHEFAGGGTGVFKLD